MTPPFDSAQGNHCPFEPLEKSAPLAWDMAPKMCHTDPETGLSCAWYHGFWQYLRQIEILLSVTADRAFLFDTFASLARQGNYRRVLIAGAADYGMLAFIAAAYRSEGVTPQITVVDICDTPLYFNKWYAGEISLPIEVCRSNIFKYRADPPFDLLCTHSFLWHIAPQWHADLIGKWRGLVRQGGKIVTSQLIYAGSAEQWTDKIDQKAAEFQDRVLTAAERHGCLPGVTPEIIAKAATKFRIETIRQRYTLDTTEVIDFFKSQRLSIETLEIASYNGTPRDLDAKPSVTDPERLHMVAVRA